MVITPPPPPVKIRAESDGGETLSLAQPWLRSNKHKSSMTTSYVGRNISCVTPSPANTITRNDESKLAFDYDEKPFQYLFALSVEVGQQQNRVNFSQTKDYFFGNKRIQEHQIEWQFNHTIQILHNKRLETMVVMYY